MLTCTYSFKKIQEVKFLIFLIDTANPAINIEILSLKTRIKSYLDANNLLIQMDISRRV